MFATSSVCKNTINEIIIPETPEDVLKRKTSKNELLRDKFASGSTNYSPIHKENGIKRKKSCVKRKVEFPVNLCNTQQKTKQISLDNFLVKTKLVAKVEDACSSPSLLSIPNTTSPYFSHCTYKIQESLNVPTEAVSDVLTQPLLPCENIKFPDDSCDLTSTNIEALSLSHNSAKVVHSTADDSLMEHELLSYSLDNVNWDAFDDCTLISQEVLQKLTPRKSSGIPGAQSKEATLKEAVDAKFKVVGIHNINQNKVELQLQLLKSDSNSSQYRSCILQGFWADTIIKEGDIVRVFGTFIDGSAVINDTSGFLIVNPDFLASSTAVVSTLFCMRKAAISQKFRHWGSGNHIMMIGSLVHQLFQEAVNQSASSTNEIESILVKILHRTDNIISMCCSDSSEAEVQQELYSFVPSIFQWISQYCSFKNDQPVNDMKIVEVRDIEDNVWCPRYGVKGKIDVTVKVSFQKEDSEMIMPLELKTGKPSFSAEHMGQVNLYNLMMEDRMQENCDGLLLYLRDKPQMQKVLSDHNVRRGLIQLRNELTHYIFKWNAMASESSPDNVADGNCYLPDPMNNKRMCQECPYILPCTLYQRAYEGKKFDSPHAMSFLVPHVTEHLSQKHLEFFRYWSHLLYLEASTSDERSFWTYDAVTREHDGLCMSFMILKDDTLTQQERDGDFYIHTFFRTEQSPLATTLPLIGMRPGDYIAISNQDNDLEIALATGYIYEIHDNSVEVLIERDLQKLRRYAGYTFRLDKIVQSRSSATGFNNLMKLMMSCDISSHLRELIIDKRPANFLATMSKSIAVHARPFLKALNKPQRKAVFKVLMANDYTLIKGMPGTGKTATIVALVRLLVQMGLSVLVTSHTHSAVDNILLKLKEYKVDFLRLGKLCRINKELHHFSFEELARNATVVSELSSAIKSKKVIASTCLSINHVVFDILKFDICIIDEASQVLLPDCLGPLYYAKKFVLVGDPKQLPPVVVNEHARQKGLQQSLFCHLETPSNGIELFLQYRMNREVMRLCNELTYCGVMQCGSDEIAMSVIKPKYSNCNFLNEYVWLKKALSDHLDDSALFLNTDCVPAVENRDRHGRVNNEIELKIVHQLIVLLDKVGLLQEDIGVITPYRYQVERIAESLHCSNFNKVEVNTVDQYQGKDKDVIIISCVRSKCGSVEENNSSTSMIIADESRLNVALSRAKKKLLIIGSKSTLVVHDCFQRLFNILRPDQVLDLPQGCHHEISDLQLLTCT